jgi:hypothetical protein
MQSGISQQEQAVRAYLQKQQEEQERNKKIALTTAGLAGVAIAAKTGKLPFGLQNIAKGILPAIMLPAQKKQGILDIMKYGLDGVFKGLKTGSSLGKNLAGLGITTATLGAIYGGATQGGQGSILGNVAHGAMNIIKLPFAAISEVFGNGSRLRH